MIKVLITGSKGQLGQCFQYCSTNYPEILFFYKNSREIDITNKSAIQNFVENQNLNYIINCAAYTNVEQAEKEPQKAYLINGEGVKNLAEVCKVNDIILIHISTDYVFDGSKDTPYTEKDITNPINHYGKSKLLGEKHILDILENYYIIRTSWLYSPYGNNFYTKVKKKVENGENLRITDAEKGTPTNGINLAHFILKIIDNGIKNFGIYHFSDGNVLTWFDFAIEILKKDGEKFHNLKLEKTNFYPTVAKRPIYSALSTKKSNKLLELYPD